MYVGVDVADRISGLGYGETVGSDAPERIRVNARVKEAYLGEAATNA